MADLDRLKVVRYTTERVPNPYPGGVLTWQQYQGVRNELVRASRKHGPTGPMGEVELVDGVDDPYRQMFKQAGFWQRGDDNPSYYIIPDRYNDERYLYAELYGDDPFKPAWLLDIVEALSKFPGWGLGINNIPGSYVLIFGDRLMVKGRAFGLWPKATKVIAVVRRLLQEAADA